MSYREHVKPLFKALGFVGLYLLLGLFFGLVYPSAGSVRITIFSDILISVIILFFCCRLVFPKDKILRQNRGGLGLKFYFTRCLEILADWLLVQLTLFLFQSFFVDASYHNYQAALSDASVAEIIILTVFLAPLTEEILMRGWVQSVIREHFGPVAGIIISSLIFAILHGTLMHLYAGFIIGLAFGILYEETRFLPLCIACHMACNVLSFVISGLAFSVHVWLIVAVAVLNLWMATRFVYCLSEIWSEYKINKFMAKSDFEECLPGDRHA